MMKHAHTHGFTLIETLVAISVLLISLAGPLSLAAQSLQSANQSRTQVTAYYLAQEGIEYVRAVRDQNFLAGADWLTGLSACIDAPCAIDFPNFSHEACDTGVCPRVLVAAGSGLFNQESGEESIYRRTVVIQTIPESPDEVKISVTVSWRAGTLNRTFTIDEYLFKWL